MGKTRDTLATPGDSLNTPQGADRGGLDGQSASPDLPTTKSLPSMQDYKQVMAAIYEVDEDTIEWLLWEETAFPACGIKHATKQLVEYFEKQDKGSDLVAPDHTPPQSQANPPEVPHDNTK